MQCPACHNEVGSQSGFCPHCGANLAAAAAPASAPPAYAAPPASYPAQAAPSAGLTPSAAAAISYITIIPAILFLILEPYNKMPLVRFHSFQSIALAIVWFAISVVVAVVSMFLAFLPGFHFLALFIFPFIHFAVFVAMFIAWLVAILKASKGEFYKLPVIGDFALKQAQS